MFVAFRSIVAHQCTLWITMDHHWEDRRITQVFSALIVTSNKLVDNGAPCMLSRRSNTLAERYALYHQFDNAELITMTYPDLPVSTLVKMKR